ncbi:MAG: dTMP kinase [Burkholderiaceae bacterium]
MKGRFITFEGIDGAGKSTQVEALALRCRQMGAEVLCTREPGGTPLAEQLRALFLVRPMDALTEALLVFAARRDHLREVILPALARGCTVLCDRFTDATFAYQGSGRGFSLEVLGQLETWVQEGVQPDLTFWFDLAPTVAARRRSVARYADRLEQLDDAFFARVRAGYRARVEAHPTRCVRIDAEQDIHTVAREIVSALEAKQW